MKITIQAPWKVNDYLKKVVKEKLEKLSTFNEQLNHAEVYLKTGVNSGIKDRLVEIRLKGKKDFFAQTAEDNFEKAVAMTTEKLKKQLIKEKEKASR